MPIALTLQPGPRLNNNLHMEGTSEIKNRDHHFIQEIEPYKFVPNFIKFVSIVTEIYIAIQQKLWKITISEFSFSVYFYFISHISISYIMM